MSVTAKIWDLSAYLNRFVRVTTRVLWPHKRHATHQETALFNPPNASKQSHTHKIRVSVALALLLTAALCCAEAAHSPSQTTKIDEQQVRTHATSHAASTAPPAHHKLTCDCVAAVCAGWWGEGGVGPCRLPLSCGAKQAQGEAALATAAATAEYEKQCVARSHLLISDSETR